VSGPLGRMCEDGQEMVRAARSPSQTRASMTSGKAEADSRNWWVLLEVRIAATISSTSLRRGRIIVDRIGQRFALLAQRELDAHRLVQGL